MRLIKNTAQKNRFKMNVGILFATVVGLTACAGGTSTGSSGVAKPSSKATVKSATIPKTASAGNAFKISFHWEAGMKKCFSRVSPPVQLMNVPLGTTTLKVVMEDADSSYAHGGGTVNYSGGSVIPSGALKSWEGPCPPSPHTYTFKVKAIGGETARARFSQKYPK